MIKKLSIRNQMFIALFIFAVAPIVIFATITYRNYANLIENQTEVIASNIVEHTTLKLNHTLNEIKKVSEFLLYEQTSKSNTILSSLKKYDSRSSVSAYEQLADSRGFIDGTESLLLSHDYIEGIYLFTSGSAIFSNSKTSGFKLDFDAKSSNWYQQTVKRMGKLYVSGAQVQDFLISENQSISFSRLLIDPESREPLGILVLNCSLSLFKDISNQIVPNSTTRVVNAEGNPLYDNGAGDNGSSEHLVLYDKIDQQAKGRFIDKNNQTITMYETIPEYGWKIIVTLPFETLTHEYNRTNQLVLLFVGLWLVLSAVIGMLIANSFSKPIMGIARLMKKYESGQSVPYKKYMTRSDEIGTLYTQYSSMLQQINTLIKDKYENQIILMSSKMRALEAQINSHFLFNTLETLNSIALIENVRSVSVISKALGDMFRYAIKTKSEIVTLREELDHIRNYETIQKFRYADKFDMIYEIDESLYEIKILKLILQPLVENAVYHGIEMKKGKGTIIISAKMETLDHLILQVRDNGVGIDPARLAELISTMGQAPSFEKLSDATGDKRSIGIYNVHARISLYYGLQYGLSIESQPSGGTTVTIIIPQRNSF